MLNFFKVQMYLWTKTRPPCVEPKIQWISCGIWSHQEHCGPACILQPSRQWGHHPCSVCGRWLEWWEQLGPHPEIIEYLKTPFQIRVKAADRFLGVELNRNQGREELITAQSQFTQALLKFNMQGRSLSSPETWTRDAMSAVTSFSIIWTSHRQVCAALSTTEAEYIGGCEASKEATWITRLMKELKFESEGVKLKELG